MDERRACCLLCGTTDALGFALAYTPNGNGACCALCAIRLMIAIEQGSFVRIHISRSALAVAR